MQHTHPLGTIHMLWWSDFLDRADKEEENTQVGQFLRTKSNRIESHTMPCILFGR